MEAENESPENRPVRKENPLQIIGAILALGCVRKLKKDRGILRQINSELESVNRAMPCDVRAK